MSGRPRIHSWVWARWLTRLVVLLVVAGAAYEFLRAGTGQTLHVPNMERIAEGADGRGRYIRMAENAIWASFDGELVVERGRGDPLAFWGWIIAYALLAAAMIAFEVVTSRGERQAERRADRLIAFRNSLDGSVRRPHDQDPPA